MKKILVLTLAMVFALASVAFAEVKISGELKSTVKYNVVDDVEDYKGAALDTAKVTLAAEEEGVWSASVTLKSKNGLGNDAVTDVAEDEDGDGDFELTFSDGHSAVVLDAYQFQFVDEWFTLDAWGGEAEVAEYGTALGFIKAPKDAETVRFTTGLPEGEAVVDFSDTTVRLFGKYQVDPSLSFGAAAQRSGSERYSVWGTGAIEGVTVSGEFMRDARVEGTRVEGNKYGAKAEYKVADLKLTGQFVRDEAVAVKADESTEMKLGVALGNDDVPYSASVDYKTKSYENDDKFNEVVLKGDYDVVPEFVTVNASYTRAKDENGNRYEFKYHDYTNTERKKQNAVEYSRIELGAEIALTEKLTIEPGVELETIERAATEIDVTAFVVDVEYAVTDNASVTYGFKRIAQETGGTDKLGYFNTLGVKLTF